jgi:hypothetical protein
MDCKQNSDCGDGFVCAHSIYDATENAIYNARLPMPKATPWKTPQPGRCVRAPLITADTPTNAVTMLPDNPMDMNSPMHPEYAPIGASGAAALIQNCFPDLARYEVHGGDAFVVSGSSTGAPVLEERDSADGSCKKPTLTTDPQFWASRMLQPRMRLGPFDSLKFDKTDPTTFFGNCPDPSMWISHRVPPSAQAASAPSCQYLANQGARSDDGSEVFGCSGTNSCAPAGDGVTWNVACSCSDNCSCSATGNCSGGGNGSGTCSGTGACTCPSGSSCAGVTGGIVLPEGNSVAPLTTAQGGPLMPVTPDPVKDQQSPTATTAPDVWINREFELFSILPMTSTTNQCVLTTAWEEDALGSSDPTNLFRDYKDPDPNDPNPKSPNDPDKNCTGFCRFPGEHTEVGGVRRIHYENSAGNLVLRVPRDSQHSSNPPACPPPNQPQPQAPCDPMRMPNTPDTDPPRWAVPPEGYLVSFLVYGGLSPYTKAAQTSQRDVSSGMLAQSLKAAIAGLDGILYLVDEGRTGSPTGLRGQVMRIVGSIVDPYFLLR